MDFIAWHGWAVTDHINLANHAKPFSSTGPVTDLQIDNVIHRLMGSYGVRHAALAIVHGTQLVYARGYH